MDRLRQMEVFAAVIDAGSFAKAGVRLRMSPPAVTRAMSALEERLGVRLLNRTTRSLNLTEPGARFLESTRRLLGEIATAEKEAVGETAIPQGHLSITSSVTFGRVALSSVVSEFLDSHQHVTASVMLFDRVVNLVEEGIDVAVRIGELPDSSLVARRVGAVRRLLVASPEYLSEHGAPLTSSDLGRHSVVAFVGLMPNREWHFVDGKRAKKMALSPRMEVNDANTAIALAEAGEGITIALSYMVAKSIAEGRLVPVLDQFAPPPVPVHLVYPQSRLLAPKIRAFVDFAAPRLRNVLDELSIPQSGAC